MIVMGEGTSPGGYMSPDRLLTVLVEHAVGVSDNVHEQ